MFLGSVIQSECFLIYLMNPEIVMIHTKNIVIKFQQLVLKIILQLKDCYRLTPVLVIKQDI